MHADSGGLSWARWAGLFMLGDLRERRIGRLAHVGRQPRGRNQQAVREDS